jgi:hypothetical protein
MTAFVQVVSILSMFAISYVGLLAFGPPRQGLRFSKAEKAAWDAFAQERLGRWLAGTNIIGTLTSFATVFLFFLGNAAVFGAVMLWCSITIWLGAFATRRLSRRIAAIPRIAESLESEDQTGGVVASLFWHTSQQRLPSRIAKAISVFNIAGVIWLEFALLGDFGGAALGIESLTTRAVLVAAAATAVIFFVLRFGIRGFVFADLFQVPIIAGCTLLLIVGTAIAISQQSSFAHVVSAARPQVDAVTLIVFMVHVLFLNAFMVVVTEPHWLRTWVFREQNLKVQWAATSGTGIVWALLVAVGLMAAALSNSATGTGAIASLLQAVGSVSVVFLSAFWFAAIAALFSTADTQLYSLLLVFGFDTRTGKLPNSTLVRTQPALSAVAAGVAIGIVYYLFRISGLPAEKLVFVIIPLSLNVLPGLCELAVRKTVSAWPMTLSTVVYLVLAVLGFMAPHAEMRLTMAAAIVPSAISLVGLMTWSSPAETTAKVAA